MPDFGPSYNRKPKKVHRKETPVRAVNLGGSASSSISDSDSERRMKAAAEVIANGARANAAAFSRRIPPATSTVVDGPYRAHIITNGRAAPNAGPFEYAKRHPLFGNKNYWYTQPHRPYMETAGDTKAQDAMNVYARVIDDWTTRLGYKEGSRVGM